MNLVLLLLLSRSLHLWLLYTSFLANRLKKLRGQTGADTAQRGRAFGSLGAASLARAEQAEQIAEFFFEFARICQRVAHFLAH